MNEDYSMVFDSDEDVPDDNSDSAYLPNILSPIQVRSEEDEFRSSEPLADESRGTTSEKEACASEDNGGDSDNDDDGTTKGHDDAGIVEAVDTLLKMHPIPSTSKKKEKSTKQQHQQHQAQKEEEEAVDEWRNATDDKSGRTYYYNRRTRETRWKLPPNAIFVPRKEKTKTSSENASSSLLGPLESSSSAPVASGANAATKVEQDARKGTEERMENVCAQEPPKHNILTPLPGAGRQEDLCSPPVVSTPAAGIRSSQSRSDSRSHSRHLPCTSNQRQNADDHPIFCLYCASSCDSIGGMADHLLECEAYMSMLAKHPRAQRRLEDTMLRTWGIKREIPVPTAEDSFDARLISHSHLGILDAVASPSIAEHLTPPNPATGNTTSSTTGSGSIHHWDCTPPSGMNARPITASTVSSARNTASIVGDRRRPKEPQYADGGGSSSIHNNYHMYNEDNVSNGNYDDNSFSPLTECAFCGRAVENLSKHLLRCKTRQRTQERRRKATAMAMASGSSHMPGKATAATTTIQRVMSGGRSLPGHPRTETRTDARIDHARRLDYY